MTNTDSAAHFPEGLEVFNAEGAIINRDHLTTLPAARMLTGKSSIRPTVLDDAHPHVSSTRERNPDGVRTITVIAVFEDGSKDYSRTYVADDIQGYEVSEQHHGPSRTAFREYKLNVMHRDEDEERRAGTGIPHVPQQAPLRLEPAPMDGHMAGEDTTL